MLARFNNGTDRHGEYGRANAHVARTENFDVLCVCVSLSVTF